MPSQAVQALFELVDTRTVQSLLENADHRLHGRHSLRGHDLDRMVFAHDHLGDSVGSKA